MKDENKTKTELIKELIAFRKDGENGTINNITERRQVERRKGQPVTEMDFLYKTALDFIQVDPKDDIYRFIGRKLKEIVGDSIILVNSYDKASDSIQVRALEGVREKTKKVLKIMGKDPFTMSFPINNERARNALIGGELTKVPGGLYKLTFGQIPKSICGILERFLNVSEIYSSGFSREKELFGNIVIIILKGTELNNRELMNTFIKQSAIMLQSKQAEEELKESEERLKILFDYAPDAYYISDIKGRFIDGNKAAERLIGYKKEELIGKSILKLKLLSLADIPKASKALTKNIMEQPTGPDELVLNRKDNSKIIVEIFTYPVKIKGNILVLGIARDITKRRQIEETLQDYLKQIKKDSENLKRLSIKLINAQEEERQKISEIIHDDIGQYITAIKINLSLVRKAIKTNNVSKAEEKLTETLSQVNHMFDELLKFNVDLHSPLLRDFGLLPALVAYVNRYKKRENIDIDFEVINLKKKLNKEIEIVIFRTVQEAFTNISKHACAANIYLQIENKKSKICVLIKDNGKGFDTKNVSNLEELDKGLGLIEMRERIETVGGNLNIKSSLGIGTQLLIEIP